MGETGTYLSIADDDYFYAKAGMDVSRKIGNYNNVTSGLAQAGEKYLKAIIECVFVNDEDSVRLLKTHNLRTLVNKINDGTDAHFSSKDCKWLGDFYFDARYPGDNYVKCSEEDALDALRIVEDIRRETLRILEAEWKRREAARNDLGQLKVIDGI